MNYKKIYEDLIERGKHRILDQYSEYHHIIPRCMGGVDDPENLVCLTPEEHYLAHQLLVKMHPENYALAKAAAMMVVNRPSNKMYGWLRRRFAKAKSEEQSGSNNSQYGTKWIHNLDLKISKRVPKNYILEDGWYNGAVFNFENKIHQIEQKALAAQKKERYRLEQEKIYREYYEIYRQVGFEEFVRQTKYPFSQANLVARFAKFLTEFKPQNGKKRGV
jgi:hypothetical protein